MSECTSAWFAIPLFHLTSNRRQQELAPLLGMRCAELAALLDRPPAAPCPPFVLDERADGACLAAVDDVPCLTWALSRVSNGGEWDAQQLQEHRIPYLRWWGSCSAFEAGAEAYGGRGEPVYIRCDSQLHPVVGARMHRRVRVDPGELQDLQHYQNRRTAILRPPTVPAKERNRD